VIIQTYEYTEDFAAPQEHYYRILAGNGYFFHVKTAFFEADVFEHAIPTPNALRPCKEYAKLTLQQKLSATTTLQAHQYFNTVRRKHHAEAYLRIFANPITGAYILDAPPQINRQACVTAMATVAPDGFCELGSIHSHPASAFHSTTDIHDEQGSDGIHIVFGYVERFVPQIIAALTVRGRRFPLDPTEVLELPYEYDGPWLDAINKGQQ